MWSGERPGAKAAFATHNSPLPEEFYRRISARRPHNWRPQSTQDANLRPILSDISTIGISVELSSKFSLSSERSDPKPLGWPHVRGNDRYQVTVIAIPSRNCISLQNRKVILLFSCRGNAAAGRWAGSYPKLIPGGN